MLAEVVLDLQDVKSDVVVSLSACGRAMGCGRLPRLIVMAT